VLTWGDKAFWIGTLSATHPIEPFDFTLPGKFDRITVNDYADVLMDKTVKRPRQNEHAYR
jgi:hypothetical protein